MTPASLEVTVSAALWALACYAGAGLVFAWAFVRHGAAQMDPAALGMPWGARGLILPGATALWPWLLWRWWRQKGGG